MSEETELFYSSHLFSKSEFPSCWQGLNTAESESAIRKVYAIYNVINSLRMKTSRLNNMEQREAAS